MLDLSQPWYRRRFWGYLAVLLIAALPVFGHLDDMPIQFYDEQRLATNAMEMNATGNLIVTTYEGQPDYSNTKPPLMIWLQAASMRLLGNNEISVRLPAALAAMATCLLLYGFCARQLRARLLGICSVLVLCTCQGYISLHGTRTGDYDSLLTLFTTGYCFSYFSFLEDEKRGRLYATFVFLLLAVMTKCVAACLMLPALLLYTLWRKKLTMVLGSKHFYAGCCLLIFPVAAYYGYRQHLDPGYFDAVAKMDLGGRYMHALSFIHGPEYYVVYLMQSGAIPWFGVSIAGIVAGLSLRNAVWQRITVFSTLVTGIYVAVLAASVTKFSWYLLPAYPMIALLAGILLYTLFRRIYRWLPARTPVAWPVAGGLFTAALFAGPYSEALEQSLNPQTLPSMMENGMMAYFMKDVLHGRRNIDGQYVAIESYQGNIRWYFRALEAQGKTVTTIEDRHFVPGQTIIAYQEEVKDFIHAHFETQIEEDFRGVIVYHIIRPKH